MHIKQSPKFLEHSRCSTDNLASSPPSLLSSSFSLLIIILIFSLFSLELLEKENTRNSECRKNNVISGMALITDFVMWTVVTDVGPGCLLTDFFFLLLFLCRKDQNVLSPVNCWNLLLNQVKRESRDHTTLSDIYLNNIIPRFVQVSEDSGRLFKKVCSCF